LIRKKIKKIIKYIKKVFLSEKLTKKLSIRSKPKLLSLMIRMLIMGKIIPIPMVSNINEKKINNNININFNFSLVLNIVNKFFKI
jgi:hypothetical protein